MNFVEIRRSIRLGIIGFIGFLFMILMVPILLPLLFLLWIICQVILLCSRIWIGWSLSKPSGMDIVNGKESFASKPYINIACRFTNRNPDIEAIRQRFQTIVLDQRDSHGKPVFDKFTKVFEQVLGYHVWRDSENFDLKNHIRLLDPKEILACYLEEEKDLLRKKGIHPTENERNDFAGINWEITLKFLLGKYGAAQVKPGHPKWEILILPETENRYTTLFRIHHSISDGLYFVRLIAECLADRPVDVRLPFKIKRGNLIQRAMMNIYSFSLLPYGLYRALVTCNDRNPLHGPKLGGKKMFLVSDPFPLSWMKDIKKVAKVTINDIIFSCVSHAAAKYFDKKKATVKEITVLLAVNMQEQNKPIRLKNNFAINALKLPTSTSGFLKKSAERKKCTILNDRSTLYDLSKLPALSRLQIVKYSIDEAKSDPSIMALSWLMKILSYLFPAVIAEALLSTKGITMDISNIQGPQNGDFFMQKAVADDVAFWLPDREPLGIGVSIVSFNGYIRVGLIADLSIIKNEEEGNTFLRHFQEEALNLRSEVAALNTSAEKGETEFTSFLSRDIP